MIEKKTIFLDANILYSWNLNHVFMFFCETGVGLVEPYWSDLAIAEAIKNIKINLGFDDTARFAEMNKAYPYANVSGYHGLPFINGVDLKDQDIAKAAIYIDCDFLVTNNLKHFKNATELQVKPKAVTADSMLTALVKNYPAESVKAVALAWWHRKNKNNFEDYLTFIGQKTSGLELVNFEKEIRGHIKSIGKTVEDAKDDALKGEVKRY